MLAHWFFLLIQRRWREALWGLACIAAAYLPWFPVFFFQIGHKVSQTFPEAAIITPFIVLVDLFWTKHIFLQRFWYFIIGFIDLLAWLIWALIWGKREKEKAALFFLLFSVPFLFPLMITWVTPLHIFSARYAVIFLPYFVFPIVKGFSKLPSAVWVPFLACFLVINLFVISLYFTSPVYQKQNFRLAAEKLRNSLKPGTSIFVEQIGSLFPLAYYLPQDLKVKWRKGMYLDPFDPGKSNLTWYGVSGTQSLPLVREVIHNSSRICLVMCQYQLGNTQGRIYTYLKRHDRQTLSYWIRDLNPESDIYIFFFKRRGLE